jgi:chemotaxis protein methyltransferase CheR
VCSFIRRTGEVICDNRMNNSYSKADELRHVRFAGRPRSTVQHLRSPGNPHVDKSAREHRSEDPGQFISQVFEKAGLAVGSYRGKPLQRRLPACLRALRAESEEHASLILERRPDLLPVAINSLLMGVTEFFRDPSIFQMLRTVILPHLASFLSRPLRVWSAGCSNGAELYSLAILLDQAGLLEGSFLLGSDCRSTAIADAKAALYNCNDIQNVGLPDRCRYFNEVDRFWQPVELLRRHTRWKVADLVHGIEKGPWDIILWRNVAIYLEPDAAKSVWKDLASVMAPEGLLIVGSADRPPASLPLSNVRRCIYRFCFSKGGHIVCRRQKQANGSCKEVEMFK